MLNGKFLQEIISNYDDHIRNIVFKLQKYSDVLLGELNRVSTPDNNFRFDNKLIGFIICESDEILKNKILATGIEIQTMQSQKYTNLMCKIGETDGIFYAPDDIYQHFFDKYKDVNWHIHFYQNYNDSVKNPLMYNFTEIFNQHMYECERYVDSYQYIKYDKNILLLHIKECHDIFNKTINTLIKLMEESPSSYRSAILMDDMLRCMVITYICVSKIQVEVE